jgi:hypothetical protein
VFGRRSPLDLLLLLAPALELARPWMAAAGRPPVAGASKTSDHALPAAVPAHAASRVGGARARTWPSRIA